MPHSSPHYTLCILFMDCIVGLPPPYPQHIPPFWKFSVSVTDSEVILLVWNSWFKHCTNRFTVLVWWHAVSSVVTSHRETAEDSHGVSARLPPRALAVYQLVDLQLINYTAWLAVGNWWCSKAACLPLLHFLFHFHLQASQVYLSALEENCAGQKAVEGKILASVLFTFFSCILSKTYFIYSVSTKNYNISLTDIYLSTLSALFLLGAEYTFVKTSL